MTWECDVPALDDPDVVAEVEDARGVVREEGLHLMLLLLFKTIELPATLLLLLLLLAVVSLAISAIVEVG